MPRKKIVCIGKCFICGTKHYQHLPGWVINGSNKLLCYELDYERNKLRTDCFRQALGFVGERDGEQEAHGNESTSQETDVRRREMELAGEGFRAGYTGPNTSKSASKNNKDLGGFTKMTKYDTETANLRHQDITSEEFLRLFQQKPINKKADLSKQSLDMLRSATKNLNANYKLARDKGIKNGYLNSQVDKKLSKASKNLSRDGWTKLAVKVSQMTDEELQAWIKL